MFPLTVYNIYVSRYSAWIFQNSKVYHSFAYHAEYENHYTDHAMLVFQNLSMTCDRFCISWQHAGGTLEFTDSSVLLLANSKASVPAGTDGEDLFFAGSNTVQFLRQSALLVFNNVLSPYRYGFYMYTGCTFDNSYAVYSSNSLLGTPFKGSFITVNGGAVVAQCNDMAGALLRTKDQYNAAGLTGGPTYLYDCPRGTQCPFANSSCFIPLANTMTSSCKCQCSSGGYGPYCLPALPPIFKHVNLLVTASQGFTKTVTATLTVSATLSEEPSRSATSSFSPSKSSNVSDSLTLSTETSASASQESSKSPSASISTSNSSTSSSSRTVSLTHTLNPSKTPSRALTPSISSTLTPLVKLTISGLSTDTISYVKESRTMSITMTLTFSYQLSASWSSSISPTQSPSQSVPHSKSRSASMTSTPNISWTKSPHHVKTVTLDRATFSECSSPSRSSTVTQSLTRTPTLSSSPSGSTTLSITSTLTLTLSKSRATASLSSSPVPPTETFFFSGSSSTTSSVSATISLGSTITPPRTLTPTVSSCVWSPLRIVPGGTLTFLPNTTNGTMIIEYDAALNSGENFTVLGLGQWYVSATTFYGETGSVNVSTYVGAPTANVIASKIPAVYAPESSRSVMIAITFRCGVVSHTELYTILINPVPPMLSAATIDTVIRVTSLASVVTLSPAAAAAAALSLIMQQIMMCKPMYESSGISLMGLTIGSDQARYVRGAIITNALVVTGEAVVVCLLAIGIIVASGNRLTTVRYWRTMEILQWPNVMHITISALLQLTTTASIGLVIIAGSFLDGALAVAGILSCFAYTVWLCRQLYKDYFRDQKWDVAEGLGTAGFVFGDYCKPWYAGLECIAYFLIGVIAGIPASNKICNIQMWGFAVMAFIMLVALSAIRPYASKIGFAFAFSVWGFIFMAAASLLAGSYATDPSIPYAVASFCLLAIPVAAMARGLYDAYSVFRYAKSWWARVTDAECLKEAPWDGKELPLLDDKVEEVSMSDDDDDEMTNFGLLAPSHVSLLKGYNLKECNDKLDHFDAPLLTKAVEHRPQTIDLPPSLVQRTEEEELAEML